MLRFISTKSNKKVSAIELFPATCVEKNFFHVYNAKAH